MIKPQQSLKITDKDAQKLELFNFKAGQSSKKDNIDQLTHNRFLEILYKNMKK